jgi:hypothetical protein
MFEAIVNILCFLAQYIISNQPKLFKMMGEVLIMEQNPILMIKRASSLWYESLKNKSYDRL